MAKNLNSAHVLERKSGKSGHILGSRSKTRDDRTTLTLHTDRALIGDVLGALKQGLGRSGSRAMSKHLNFAHVFKGKSGKSWRIWGPRSKTT